MNFDEALQYLLSLGHETLAMKLGLRNTELLLEALESPHKSYESIQIAGTNGKGSTAVMLDSICRAAGIRTGLYTSPHLISITERIKVGGTEISNDDFAQLATKVRNIAETLVDKGELEALPTFFEHVTVIALMAFKNAGVELAILETGLGGRLDSTTVAGAGTVAITPIAMDHEEYLGHTITGIAAEKAAIIRPGVRVIIGAQTSEALRVILNRSSEVGVIADMAEPRMVIEHATNDGRYVVTLTTTHDEYMNLAIGLRGQHQIENASLAVRVAESIDKRRFAITKTAIYEGIKDARYSGRLELIEGTPALLLDGAHNPAGAQALRRYLDAHVDGPITLIFGAMKEKNIDQIAKFLFPKAAQLIVTAPMNPRAAPLAQVEQFARDHLADNQIYFATSVKKALAKAKEITPPEGLICVTGSLYLVGEVKADQS